MSGVKLRRCVSHLLIETIQCRETSRRRCWLCKDNSFSDLWSMPKNKVLLVGVNERWIYMTRRGCRPSHGVGKHLQRITSFQWSSEGIRWNSLILLRKQATWLLVKRTTRQTRCANRMICARATNSSNSIGLMALPQWLRLLKQLRGMPFCTWTHKVSNSPKTSLSSKVNKSQIGAEMASSRFQTTTLLTKKSLGSRSSRRWWQSKNRSSLHQSRGTTLKMRMIAS